MDGAQRHDFRLPGCSESGPVGGRSSAARRGGGAGQAARPGSQQSGGARRRLMGPVYFDHNATTPVADAVWERMLPFFRAHYGNASSRHGFGRSARQAVEEAREQVAATVGAHPSQVIFTSGGTEANNLAIKGVAGWMKPGTVAVSAIEHPCVLQPAQDLRRQGWKLREV